MMRAPVLALLALTAPLAAPVAAVGQAAEGSATAQMNFRGAVDGACRVSAPTASGLQNISATSLGPGSASLAVTNLVDADGLPQGATLTITLPATCNEPHTFSLQSLKGGLVSDTPANAGGPFRSELPYTVTVSWAGFERTFVTTASQFSLPVASAASGPITVTVQIPAGGQALSAGAYSDDLILELGAAG